MSSHKRENTESSSPSKRSTPRRQGSLLTLSLPLMATMLVVMALLTIGVDFFLKSVEKEQAAERSAVLAARPVATINDYLRYHQAMIDSVGGLSAENFAAQVATDADWHAQFPGALYARSIPAATDPTALNGLSYAHQDLMGRINGGKLVTPEISFMEAGGVKAQVVTFARIGKLADGTITGVLIVSYPLEPLAKSLRAMADVGRLELRQKTGDEVTTLLSVGEAVSRDASANDSAAQGETLTTANPVWTLQFSQAASTSSYSVRELVLGFGVLLTVIALLLAWRIVAGLQRQVKEDLLAVDAFCENFYRYGNRQRPQMHFSEADILLAHLDQYGSELRAGRAAAATDGLGDLSLGIDDPDGLFSGNTATSAAKAGAKSSKIKPKANVVKAEVFRAYDIRGVVGSELTPEFAQLLGRAIASEVIAKGQHVVAVARDGRLSGPELVEAIAKGMRESGCDVIDVGMVPTPVLYFAAKQFAEGSGVMVTGSHNPPDYNGFKIMVAGDTLAGDAIQKLRKRIEAADFAEGIGTYQAMDVVSNYADKLTSDIAMAKPMRVVVDAGNGVAGAIAPRILEALGCTVVPLFCEVDGNFPNHHPDPSKPDNLLDLMSAVQSQGADIGIAFDGDGDRIGVVTPSGKNIFADRLMMLYAKHVLAANPGADIIFDVKCTRDLPMLISQQGGRPVMCKTGHSFIKAKLKETGAVLAGEMSGHIFFNDRWFGFDDAVYAAARLLEILSLETRAADEIFAEFPENPSTPEINIPVPDESKFAVMEALKFGAAFDNANVITIDGLRVEFSDGWGLVRASNTTPCLVARFEGRTPEALERVKQQFRDLLLSVDSSLTLNF